MGRKNTGRVRKARQEARKQYTMWREDEQLRGSQPTTPEGAMRDERVPPCADDPAPELVRQAICLGWNVSEEGKRKCVDDLVAAIRDPATRESLRVRCFQALMLADKVELERGGS